MNQDMGLSMVLDLDSNQDCILHSIKEMDMLFTDYHHIELLSIDSDSDQSKTLSG